MIFSREGGQVQVMRPVEGKRGRSRKARCLAFGLVQCYLNMPEMILCLNSTRGLPLVQPVRTVQWSP